MTLSSQDMSYEALKDYMPPEDREELLRLLAQDKRLFYPTPGPQYAAATSTADIIGYGGAAGGGKLLRLDEMIATPSGFTEMGALKVGDEVLDKDGRICRVRHLGPIEPAPELWEMLFDDGTRITSCVDHQWVTFNADELAALTQRNPEWKAARRAARPSRATGRRSATFTASLAARNTQRAAAQEQLPLPEGSVRTTRQIIETLITPSGRHNHAVQTAQCLELSEAELPIDPYVLGAWLGDGTTVNGGFTNIDSEISEEIKAAGFEMSHYADGKAHTILKLKPKLRDVGVLGFKHIPEAYLRASAEQRLALLQGLMDTDGTVAKHSGAAEFCNTNEHIVDGVHELICSLGWKVNRREGRARLYGKDCGPKWTLKWVADAVVFRLPRKAALQKIATRRTTKFRYIIDAVPMPSEPGRCIQVDSPSSTYLVGRALVPTHNSWLITGLALTEHKRSAIFRQHKNQTRKFVQDFAKLLGDASGYSSQNSEWKHEGRLIEFGGLEDPNDHEKWQGRDHDFYGLDEITQMREYDVRYVIGWCRSDDPDQKCRIVLTFNPPTTAEGRWVFKYFAPWLDKTHPNPAKDGEIRWFTTIGDNPDFEVPDGRRFVLTEDGEFDYDFDPKLFAGPRLTLIKRPKSRTFITARVTDNPYYVATGYIGQLQNLPEPLRSQMLEGDFLAGVEDDAQQVMPTAWVEAAQARHVELTSNPLFHKGPQDALGVDAARGGNMGGTAGIAAQGKDKMVISPRHGTFFDAQISLPGIDVNTGNLAAAQILAHRKDQSPIQLDVAAIGTSVLDALRELNQHVVPLNGTAKSFGVDKSNLLRFVNKRAELHWRMREALDPALPDDRKIALPPDPELLADLTAPRWELKTGGIQIEAKDDIKKRIGRSPDKGEAAIYALIATPKRSVVIGGLSGVSVPGPSYEEQRLKELEER